MNLGRHFGFSDEMLDRVAHANTMAIAPEHRRRGIGNNLFNLAMGAMPEHAEYIMTTTRLENALARQLLESRGFRCEKAVHVSGQQRYIYVLDRAKRAV